MQPLVAGFSAGTFLSWLECLELESAFTFTSVQVQMHTVYRIR